jgi:hypothetical protein
MSGVVSYDLFSSRLGGTSGFTSEGGFFQYFVNNTGATSILGTIVVASTTLANAVMVAPANSPMPIGIIAESGIANGDPVKVVTYGKAYVLLENGLSSSLGYWCGVSPTAGRMYQLLAVPTTLDHNREIGYSLQANSSGTDVLSLVQVHFN